MLTPTLNFEFGDEDTSKRTIRLQRTIPVGCLAEDKCSIELLTTIPEGTNAEQCSILTLEGRRCGVEIQSEGAVNQEINITVSPADVGQYTDFEIYNEVHLRVAETANNKIWNNYSLEPIGVSIHIRIRNYRFAFAVLFCLFEIPISFVFHLCCVIPYTVFGARVSRFTNLLLGPLFDCGTPWR